MYMCSLPFNVEQYPWSSMRWILFSWSAVPWTVHFWAVKTKKKTDCASFTLASIISAFLEQSYSWAANRWDINQWGFHVPTKIGVEHWHILQHFSSWHGRRWADQFQQTHILIHVGTAVCIQQLDSLIKSCKGNGSVMTKQSVFTCNKLVVKCCFCLSLFVYF